MSKPVASLVKSAISIRSKDPRAGNATGSSSSSSTSACGRMITAAIVHGVGVPPPPVMSMSRCAHRERGASARGSFDFGRTDTTSCTERANGDQENEQRFCAARPQLPRPGVVALFPRGHHHLHPTRLRSALRPTATKVIPTTWGETANHSGGADYRREGRPILAGFPCAVNPGGLSGSPGAVG